jgi:nitric oxide reductase NorD protein
MHPARLIRNRMIGVARRVRAQVNRLRPARPATLDFVAVRRRLDILLAAMFNQPLGDGLLARVPTAQPNDRSIVLPPSIPDTCHPERSEGSAFLGSKQIPHVVRDDNCSALERYRILAIEQGARIARGTRAKVPLDPVERDLYMIIEGASIDAELAGRAPGLARSISRMRREELARRPELGWLRGAAHSVEALLQQLLATAPDVAVSSIPRSATPQDSAAAARVLANGIQGVLKKGASYNPIRPVDLWDDDRFTGRTPYTPSTPPEQGNDKPGSRQSEVTVEESKEEGKRDDPNASLESDEAEEKQGGAGASPDTVGDEVWDRPAELRENLPEPTPALEPGGIQYPEWVDRLKRLEPHYATVYPADAPEGDGAWARAALLEHGAIIRQLRDRFSLLRARRMRLRAQRSGEELDLDACVNALIDMQLKRVPSDRLYQSTRSSRHSLAITILVDVSGSTRELLPNGQTVLDVERLSVVLASEALTSLGDPYSILAFSGKSRHNVRVATVKSFAERDLGVMHRRVSSLEPDDSTRLGAAVRHATAQLLAQHAHRRVLLILSDGKPHDVDWYWEGAAVEDSRVAILEARAAGVHSFCVTVDSKEADYLPHLFGEGRYWVLADPTELPKALIRLIDTILTS